MTKRKTYIVYKDDWPLIVGTMAEISRALDVSISTLCHARRLKRKFNRGMEIHEVER